MTGHPKLALGRCEHRREQSDRRRLARSVAAQQSDHIARIGREAEVLDGAMWSVGLGESYGFERDAHRAPVVEELFLPASLPCPNHRTPDVEKMITRAAVPVSCPFMSP